MADVCCRFAQMLEDYWGPAKRLLGDMKFLERLKKYDRDNVPPRIIEVIRKKFVTDPEFTPDSVARASRYQAVVSRFCLVR